MTLEGYEFRLGPLHGEGAFAFRGAVFAGNGKVILTPYNSDYIGIYDPVEDTYTRGPAHGMGNYAFADGILLADGRILFCPLFSSRIGLYDPDTNTFELGAAHGGPTNAYVSPIQLPSGKVILTPREHRNVGIYDPETDTFSTGPYWSGGVPIFGYGVLLGNGKILFVPDLAGRFMLFDPDTETWEDGPSVSPVSINMFLGAVLTADGTKVICIPNSADNVGIYTVETNTFAWGVAHGKSVDAYEGGLLSPDGKIIFNPNQVKNMAVYDPETDTLEEGPEINSGSTYLGYSRAPAWDQLTTMVMSPCNNANVGILTVPFVPPPAPPESPRPEPILNPKIMIRWRDNGKAQWSNYREISLGPTGDTTIIKKIRKLGQYETRQYEIVCTSNVPITIAGVNEDVTTTNP